MSAHVTTVRAYGLVLATLLTLTVITVLAAGVRFGDGAANVVIALGIASIKASLVALYFMHLRHDKPLYAIILLTGVAFLALFLAICFIDVETRDNIRPSNLKPTVAAPQYPGGQHAAPK
jgi:cytochrome c oxidase subunit 4